MLGDFMVSVHLAVFALDRGLMGLVGACPEPPRAGKRAGPTHRGEGLRPLIGNRSTLVIVYLIRASSLVLLLSVPDESMLYIFSILFGLTFFTTAPPHIRAGQ